VRPAQYPYLLRCIKEIDMRVSNSDVRISREVDVLAAHAQFLSGLKHATPLSEILGFKLDNWVGLREDHFRALLFLACEGLQIP
jgi:hypothetical protein